MTSKIMKKHFALSVAVLAIIILSGCTLPDSNADKAGNKDIGVEAAKEKALDFVKNNMVQPGVEVSVKETAKEGELYRIVFKVEDQEFTGYISQNGIKFFPEAMDIAEVEKQIAEQKKKEEEALKDVPKTDKPVVDLYVMSFCPYGNRAEDTMKPVYDLLKDKVDFNFRYIVSSSGNAIQSLHGQPEVVQNEREACVMKNYGKDAWMSFVTYVNKNCGSDGSCWEVGAKANNIDTSKINSCVKSEGVELMKADEKLATGANASGSPTMIINGVQSKAVYQYGNSDGYKQAICNAFNEAPAECAQVLSSATSTAEGGSCN